MHLIMIIPDWDDIDFEFYRKWIKKMMTMQKPIGMEMLTINWIILREMMIIQ